MTDEIITRVEAACAHLATHEEPITFAAVARRAQIARATLYRRPELRALVEHHREQHRNAHTLTGLAEQITSLQDELAELADTVHRHEQALRQTSTPPAPD